MEVEGSNESVTEDPSVRGSGEKEPENSEVSAAKGGFGGGADIRCFCFAFSRTTTTVSSIKNSQKKSSKAEPRTPEKNWGKVNSLGLWPQF